MSLRGAGSRTGLDQLAALTLLCALGSSSCRSGVAAADVMAVAHRPPPPPPPAPPPPAPCESLAEECVATTDTRLPVGKLGAIFTPPLGWKQARTPARALAAQSDERAWLVLVAAAPGRSDAALAVLRTELEALEIRGVSLSQLRARLNQADEELSTPAGPLQVWHVDAETQNGKSPVRASSAPGSVLFGIAHAHSTQTIVAVAFIGNDARDPATLSAVTQALQSLTLGP